MQAISTRCNTVLICAGKRCQNRDYIYRCEIYIILKSYLYIKGQIKSNHVKYVKVMFSLCKREHLFVFVW